MKKGFTIALLVLAVVAVAFSASANAPIINTLPAEIIVGNLEDVAGNLSILRYNDAVDINSSVNWNNPGYGWDKFKIYLHNAATGTTSVAAYDADGYTTPVTNAVLTALQDGAEADITPLGLHAGLQGTQTSFKMGFIDEVAHAVGIAAGANPYSAAVAALGTDLSSGTYDKRADVTVIAAVTSGVLGLKTDTLTMSVICRTGANDGATASETYDFTQGGGSTQNWKYIPQPGGAAYQQVPQLGPNSTNGIGFALTGTVTTAIGYSSWKSQPELPVRPAASAPVYKIVARINSNQASGSMGYRFSFNNVAFTHYGELLVVNKAELDDVDPATANFAKLNEDFEARMYFEPPLTLGLMGDTSVLATNVIGAGDGDFPTFTVADLRAYSLNFQALAIGTDTGQLAVKTIDVQGYTPPAATAGDVKVDFGATTTYTPTSGAIKVFNTNNWAIDAPTGTAFKIGQVVINATNVTLQLPSAPTAADITAGRFFSFAAATNSYAYFDKDVALQPVSNKLYRFVMQLSATAANTCPVYRTGFVTAYATNAAPFVTKFRKMSWQENFGGGWAAGAGKPFAFNPANTDFTVPMALSTSAAAPSNVNCYIYSHRMPTATGNARLIVTPQVSVIDTMFNQAITDYAQSVWPFPNATVTLGYAAWHDLGDGN